MDKFVVFHIDGGCGKNIMATAVIESINAAYPEHKIVVVSAYPEVFLHNPKIYRVYKFGFIPYFFDEYINNKDSIILRLEPYHSGDYLYGKKSLVEIWCDLFDIPCVTKKPNIFLTEREHLNAFNNLQKNGPILMVQTFGGSEKQEPKYSWSRDLNFNFVQDVVNSVRHNFDKVVQIRRENQPKLENTFSLTDSFRNLFHYINLADKFLCIDSFAQHAVAALDKSATVGWIATSPVVFGYDTNTNIVANGVESFRHRIDSYLEKSDWSGTRMFECPYDNLLNIFNKEEFIKSLTETKNVNPKIIEI